MGGEEGFGRGARDRDLVSQRHQAIVAGDGLSGCQFDALGRGRIGERGPKNTYIVLVPVFWTVHPDRLVLRAMTL